MATNQPLIYIYHQAEGYGSETLICSMMISVDDLAYFKHDDTKNTVSFDCEFKEGTLPKRVMNAIADACPLPRNATVYIKFINVPKAWILNSGATCKLRMTIDGIYNVHKISSAYDTTNPMILQVSGNNPSDFYEIKPYKTTGLRGNVIRMLDRQIVSGVGKMSWAAVIQLWINKGDGSLRMGRYIQMNVDETYILKTHAEPDLREYKVAVENGRVIDDE